MEPKGRVFILRYTQARADSGLDWPRPAALVPPALAPSGGGGGGNKGVGPVLEPVVIPATVNSGNATSFGAELSMTRLRHGGKLVENTWQFSALYAGKIPAQDQRWSRWQYPAVELMDPDTGGPSAAYWRWREAGETHGNCVENPVEGADGSVRLMGHVLHPDSAYAESGGRLVTHSQARRLIFCTAVTEAVRHTEAFKRMYETLHTQPDHHVMLVSPDCWCSDAPCEVTEAVVRHHLSQSRGRPCHALVIAALLLDGEAWLTETE